MIKIFKKGFTIVELVIVIAVIAVLASVLVPTFTNIINKANESKMIQECTNAFKQYNLENPNIRSFNIANNTYYVAYFSYKQGNKIYHFRCDEEENIVAIEDNEFPDFSECAYIDCYTENPIHYDEDQLKDITVNLYRLDNRLNGEKYYYEWLPFNNELRTLFLINTSKSYWYKDDLYYSITPLEKMVFNEINVPKIIPGTKYIEDNKGIRYSSNGDGTASIVGYVGKDKKVNIPEQSPNYEDVTIIEQKAFYNKTFITQVVLPNTLKTIKLHAFEYCNNLVSINFPKALKVIGVMAFYYCLKLTNVSLPEELEEIQTAAFCFCPALTSVSIPKNAILGGCPFGDVENLTFMGENPTETETYKIIGSCIINKKAGKVISGTKNTIIPTEENITTIGSHCFVYSQKIRSIFIPTNITTLDTYCFYYSKIEEITGGENLKIISQSSFTDCKYLKTFHLTSKIEKIGSCAFLGCTNLEVDIENGFHLQPSVFSGSKAINIQDDNPDYYKINGSIISRKNNEIICSEKEATIPTNEEIDTILYDGYARCNFPNSNLIIPSNIKHIGDGAFSVCDLGTVYVGPNVISLGMDAFSFCRKLTEVVIEANISVIKEATFCNDTSLKKLSLPKTIVKISNLAFEKTTSLSDIYFGGTSDEWKNIDLYEGWNDSFPSCTIHCSDKDLSFSKS